MIMRRVNLLFTYLLITVSIPIKVGRLINIIIHNEKTEDRTHTKKQKKT